MYRTRKILFLCLFFVGTDIHVKPAAVSDKSRHESITKFTNFWQELLLYISDLKAATRAGYKMGYTDCIKNKEPMAPQLQSMLDQEREKNEILEEKLAQVSAESSKTTEMLSKTTAYLENVRQAHNTRSKEFAEKNTQIDELKNKVQSLENEKSILSSEKATLEKEKESIAQTSKKQMAAIFSSFKNKLDESKPKPETSEPEKPEPKSSTPSPKPTAQNTSSFGVIDDEKERLCIENENLKKQLQELEQSQTSKEKRIFFINEDKKTIDVSDPKVLDELISNASMEGSSKELKTTIDVLKNKLKLIDKSPCSEKEKLELKNKVLFDGVILLTESIKNIGVIFLQSDSEKEA